MKMKIPSRIIADRNSIKYLNYIIEEDCEEIEGVIAIDLVEGWLVRYESDSNGKVITQEDHSTAIEFRRGVFTMRLREQDSTVEATFGVHEFRSHLGEHVIYDSNTGEVTRVSPIIRELIFITDDPEYVEQVTLGEAVWWSIGDGDVIHGYLNKAEPLGHNRYRITFSEVNICRNPECEERFDIATWTEDGYCCGDCAETV